MQAMMPTLRADFELCDTYVYQEEAPFVCPFPSLAARRITA